jgi:CO/xanthine dehydrogenase FAD-binding subunit
MDLNTIREVARPRARSELPIWAAGDAWLAGGTWLFSEPQVHLYRLIDLTDLRWPALTIDAHGLSIAATCTIAELDALACPPEWLAAPLFNQCCRAFLASFKIWKTATIGGNLCMSLPAGPMISLASALDGVCTIWQANGGQRKVAAAEFITGNHSNVLNRGELLRQIDIPLAALKRRSAFRQISLTPIGRSAALLIGTIDGDGAFALTVTASTKRPVKLVFAKPPKAIELREAIAQSIPDPLYHDDIHGKPFWRKHMTLRLAQEILEEIRGELA